VTSSRRVAAARCADPRYPEAAPFDPGERWPETRADAVIASSPNPVYAAVRESFRLLDLDRARFGRPDWNPLGDLVKPGARVLLKPNLVRHENHGPGGTDCLVTHGSVVRAVLDYVLLALQGKGEIWIGDSPVQSCEFEKVVEVTGLRATVDEMRRRTGMKIGLIDFRLVRTVEDGSGVAGNRYELAGDPNGLVPVNLGADSMLAPLDAGADRYRVTGYDCEATPQHHGGGKHEFLMSRTALDADLVINLPKLKTHRKAGMTCALKNLVGLNGDKSWLPHHRAGAVDQGGDEYPKASARKAWISRLDYEVDRAGPGVQRAALRAVRKAVHQTKHVVPFTDFFREGSWHGNDTIWRTVLDLNRAALYARGDGKFGDKRRAWLTVVDAVVGGENEGPLRPDPITMGVVLAGRDQALVDLACAKLAGLDPARLPTVRNAFDVGRWPISDHRPEDLEIAGDLPVVPMRPSAGWLGHCEAVERRGGAPLEVPEDERRDVA
jgi:uncharacterized protein (DUF362 family)